MNRKGKIFWKKQVVSKGFFQIFSISLIEAQNKAVLKVTL